MPFGIGLHLLGRSFQLRIMSLVALRHDVFQIRLTGGNEFYDFSSCFGIESGLVIIGAD